MIDKPKSSRLAKSKRTIFVLKIGGEVIQSKNFLARILAGIKELRDAGIDVVLAHGGGPQADFLSRRLGHTPKKINGRRVTGEVDLEIAKMLYGGSLNLEILSLMKTIGLKGVRVSGVDGGLLDVKLRDKTEVDFGYVGDIEKVHVKILKDLFSGGYVPVVSPLAATAEGALVNINADTVATRLAISLRAKKLILFTNTDGVFDGRGNRRRLTVSDAKKLIGSGVINGGMAVKVDNCLEAIRGGVPEVQIMNGLSPRSLPGESLITDGAGTMIIADEQNLSQK